VALEPVQPPEAVQEVAFVVDQLRVELLPLTMELGLAARLTVGAGVGEVTETVAAWVALPPLPVQVNE
jgi:SpoU rRNA methylase family enzyme